MRLVVFASAAAAPALLVVGCNEHVFRYVPDRCEAAAVTPKTFAVDKAADILVVVDNSGSMCEEQANLVENFFDPDCRITADGIAGSGDLRPENILPELRNPTEDEVRELSRTCGFIQILAAYENDFRVGVITTDVSPCDNDADQADGFERPDAGPLSVCGDLLVEDWGRRPQRGCLQAPAGQKKVFDREDADIAERFKATLDSVLVFGSGFERGLDAMQVFLSAPPEDRAPGCEADLQRFLREDAKLVVIFLTDEDDCSHDVGVFPDENAADRCSIEEGLVPNPTVDARACYQDAPNSLFSALAPVDRYARFLEGVKGEGGDVALAVIAGAAKGADGSVEPAGCRVGPGGAPDLQCVPAFGSSNISQLCPADAAVPCCVADPATRYFAFADAFSGPVLKDSICFDSFRTTMIDIARFIAAEDHVELRDPPDDPEAIVVLVHREGEAEPTAIPRLPDDADCAASDGWIFEAPKTVRFCGDGQPRPGDEVAVHAREQRQSDAGCAIE